MDTAAPSPPDDPPLLGRPISGFLRRVGALIIDSLILGLLGTVAGVFALDFFAGLGGWGRLIGFAVALLYFGPLNSSLGHGQTPGKRLLKIKVVNAAGETISLARSCGRQAVFSAPFFLNGAMLPMSLQLSWIGFLIGFLVFGLGGAIVYLAIFNRTTRQSVHDLVANTCVVRTEGPSAHPGRIWKGHYAVLGGGAVVMLILLLLTPALIKVGPFPKLLGVQQAIQATGLVHTSSVMIGKSWKTSSAGQEESSYLSVYAIMRERPRDYKATARKIGLLVVQNYPEVRQRDTIIISIAYGYDIGISKMWTTENFHGTPGEFGSEPAGKN